MDPCRLTLPGAGCTWATYPPGSVDDHAHQVGIPPVPVAEDLRARLGDERMRRATDALRAARQGIPAVSDRPRYRHLLARLEPEGRAYHRPPPGPGSKRREAALTVARAGPGFALKGADGVASRPLPAPEHQAEGLAVSWLTHCPNRLSRRWTIRSRS